MIFGRKDPFRDEYAGIVEREYLWSGVALSRAMS